MTMTMTTISSTKTIITTTTTFFSHFWKKWSVILLAQWTDRYWKAKRKKNLKQKKKQKTTRDNTRRTLFAIHKCIVSVFVYSLLLHYFPGGWVFVCKYVLIGVCEWSRECVKKQREHTVTTTDTTTTKKKNQWKKNYFVGVLFTFFQLVSFVSSFAVDYRQKQKKKTFCSLIARFGYIWDGVKSYLKILSAKRIMKVNTLSFAFIRDDDRELPEQPFQVNSLSLSFRVSLFFTSLA